MRVLSINVGLPREIEWRGETVLTSIFKEPITGRVRVARLNLDGDRQSDLTVHGGRDKAVYVYPSEHYPLWRQELPGVDIPWGMFGENLTTEGILEDAVHVGDRLRAGSAEFVVTQPRMPCFKLGIRFDDPHMVKRFLHSGRSGFYLAVLREGDVAAGDSLEFISRDEQQFTIAEVAHMYTGGSPDQERLRRLSELPALPERWREHFRKQVAVPTARRSSPS
jgi:MOSC domain-containing protein YiiM